MKRDSGKRGKTARMKPRVKRGLRKWRGRCAGSFSKLGYSSVDQYMEDIRGR